MVTVAFRTFETLDVLFLDCFVNPYPVEIIRHWKTEKERAASIDHSGMLKLDHKL